MIKTPDEKKPDQANDMKKKILKVFLIIGVGMLMMFAMLYVLSLDFDKFLYDEISVDPPSTVYPADFNEDIFKDPEYLEKDRLINFSDYRVYQDGGYISIDSENYTKYGEEAIFMYEFLQSIINGDVVFYNSCFSDRYFEVEDKQQPFTMQKLYNINIRLLQVGEAENDIEFAYIRLEYCIFKNNQTLRDDIGSDHSRTQFFTLVRDSHDRYKIQGIQTIKPMPQKVLNVVNLALIILVAAAIGAAIVLGVIFILKKDKNKKKAKTLSDRSSDPAQPDLENEAEKEENPKREE